MRKLTLNHVKGLIGIGLFGFALGSAAPAMANCPGTMSENTGADADNACEVTNWTELQAIGTDATTLGLHYKLMNDLSSATSDYVGIGDGFIPLGDSTDRFTGHFDGNYKLIRNLVINQSSASNVGLLGTVGKSATVKKLGLVNVNVTGQSFVGALIGENRGIVSEVFSTGTVTATTGAAGGLIGHFDCSQGSPRPSLRDAYSLSQVSSGDYVGGLIGTVISSSCSTEDVQRTYTTGVVSTSSSNTNHLQTAIGGGRNIARTTWVDSLTATSTNYGGGAQARTTGSLKRKDSDAFVVSWNGTVPWDFTDVWAIVDSPDPDETKERISYPYLKGFTYDALDATVTVNPIPGLSAKWAYITDWEDLANISNDLAANYSLQNSLTPSLADYAQYAGPTTNSGKGWATLSTGNFSGRLKGNGYAIDGLRINDPSASSIGIFVAVAGKGEVSDLIISNFSVTGNRTVGTLAGTLRDGASIKNVLVTNGTVTATTSPAAGLVAQTTNVTGGSDPEPIKTITDTAVDDVTVTIQSGATNLYAGGLVATSLSTNFERVYFNGTINTTTAVGGLVGQMRKSTLKDAYTIGSIVSSGSGCAGGVIAVADQSPVVIENVHTAISISHPAPSSCVGGVIGSAGSVTDQDKLNNTTFFDIAQGGVVPGSSVKGKASSTAALLTTETFTDAGWDFTDVWQQDEGDSYPYFRNTSTQPNAPIQNPPPKPVAIACPTGLTAASDGACLINNWTDLTKVNDKPLIAYRLNANLDAASTGHQTNWTPLSAFGGTLDGNGKTISDLVIDATSSRVGLFSQIGESGVVQDLALIGVDIKANANSQVGAIAGVLDGTIRDSFVSGTITAAAGAGNIGGFAGDTTGTANLIERSASYIAFDTGSANFVGGLIGWSTSGGAIKDSYAAVSIKGTGNHQGGLIGYGRPSVTISNSYSRSSFEGTATTRGGLAAGAPTTDVVSSYWDQEVTGVTVSTTVGGGAPRNTVEMKSRSTFAGWDFGTSSTTGVWSIVSEDVEVAGEAKKRVSYPYLTTLAAHGFIDPSQEADIGPIDTVTPALDLAATTPFTPEAGSTDVVPYTAIRVQFAENISVPNTSTITLKNAAGTTITSTKTVSGATITITPAALLSYDETYTITVPANIVASSTDATKKNLTVTWSFSTQSGTITGGDGCPGRMLNASGDPTALQCQITNWSQLAAINSSTALSNTDARTPLGLSYILANDLGPDTEGYEAFNTSSAKGWTPIGNRTTPFHGILDGNGKIIRGLTIKRDTESYIGLFGRVALGHVKNLVLQDVSIEGRQYVGAIAGSIDQAKGPANTSVGNVPLPNGATGQTSTLIERVFVSGTLTLKSSENDARSGGLFGRVYGDVNSPLVISEVGFAGNVLANFKGNLGGLIGLTEREQTSGVAEINISHAYFFGQITSSAAAVGGLIGRVQTGIEVNLNEAYSAATLNLSSTGDQVGSLFGMNFGSIELAKDIYWLNTGNWTAGSTTQPASGIGSNSGFFAPTGSGSIIEITDQTDMLGVAAETNLSALDFTANTGFWASVPATTPGAVGDMSPILANLPALPQIQGQLGPRQCSDVIANGYGLEASPCEISNWNELKAINEFPGSFYKLTANIDKSSAGYSTNFTALDPFYGTFDGNNLTIKDLVIKQTSTGNTVPTGLFSRLGTTSPETQKATVKNLNLARVDIESAGYAAGALAGVSITALIDNVHVSGKVTGTGTSNERIGGLVGEIGRFTPEHTITGSSSSVTVSGQDMVGGLVGYRSGTITESFATGNVTGRSQVGGLVGRVSDEDADVITDSYATGNVTGEGAVGGLIGTRVGQSSGSVTLTRVFASGDVVATGDIAGGLIGRFVLDGTLNITDAYATGDVTGNNSIGGFMGAAGSGTITINRAFSTGKVTQQGSLSSTATRFVGGFLGSNEAQATITNAYWDKDTSEQATSAGLDATAGLTSAQMRGAAASTGMTNLGFGATDAWVTVVQGTTAGALSDGYPILKALPVPPQLNAHGVGLGSLGINLTEPALSLFNDIISASNLNIALTAANAEALQAAATAAQTIIGVASGTTPRTALMVAMLTGIGITGVDADNLNGAALAIANVSDPTTLITVAAVQAVVTTGVTAYESAAPVIEGFVGGGGGTPPTPGNYDDVGVKDVTNDNVGAINDLVKNKDINTEDTEGFQHLVDAYNEIITALGDTPKRDPGLTEEDYAALGFGDIVVSGDIADLFNSLLGQLDVNVVKGWGTANPATTYTNLKARAELAAKVIGFADEDASSPAELIQTDLEDLFVDNLLGDAAQVSLFNQVVGGSRPGDVSSVEKLQAIATAMGPVLGGTATLTNYNAIGLGLTNGMISLFDEVLTDQNESPVTYATLKEVAGAVSSVIDVAAGVGSKTPLTLASLETIGITLTDDIRKAFPQIYLAIADTDPTTLTSVAAVTAVVNAAVTAANTFDLTVVNGSLSGAYLSGTTVTLVANPAPEGQYFDGWTGATVADPDAPVTTLTMPGADTTVTATYQAIPIPEFTLTVTAGSGDGSYQAGRQVTISADLPATGKIFDRWTGGDGIIDNPTKSVATLVMPASNQTVTATYIDDPNQLFGLNVGAGAGSGEYKAGERIAIAANEPAADQVFDRWSGDVQHLDNAANPNTRVTMPRSSVTVVALYVDKPDPLYALTVTGGEGGGEFTAGSTVTISAGIPADGQMFDRWLGDVAHVANVNEANTQVIMPSGPVSVRASYVPVPVTKYALTVDGGSGAGSYEAGDVITISAALPPAGQVFDQWVGQTSRVANVSQPNTTITMPASTVSIRASYKDKPAVRFELAVSGGNGSGSYEQGQVVSIEADLPADGLIFDRWTGQTDAVANINVPNTTLVMPGTDISLSATYKPDPESTPTLGRGRGRGRALEGGKPGPFTGRTIVEDLIEEQVPAGTFVALTAPEAPEVIVNNAPVDLYFDKWVGQTAYLNNVHATTAFMYMPNHDVTVLAQFRSIDGTITVTAAGTVLTLGSSTITGDTELVPGSVVTVVANAPAAGFMFDKWIGQTAYLKNVNVPETELTVPGTNIEIQATYRRVPATDTAVSIAGGDAVNRTPGTYITISAAEPEAGASFDLWGGQNAYVENVFDQATRMYVPVSSVSVNPVYKSAFGQGVDPEAATALLDFDGSQATAPSAATYTAAGISGVVAANVAVYNAALATLEPTQLSGIQAVVNAYNGILSAANGNSATPAALTIANYAALGITIATAEQLAVVNNAVGSQNAGGVDTVAKVGAIADSAARFIAVANGQSVSQPLTPADFARLGFDNITSANIDEAVALLVQAVQDGTEPSDIATLQGLFNELAPPPLPVPTLSIWALVFMALMMWLLIGRRRSLFAE